MTSYRLFVLSISVTFTTLLHSPNNINYTLPVVASHLRETISFNTSPFNTDAITR